MSKLTLQDRAAEPKRVFAGPDRSFPITDIGHAQAAERLAPYSAKKGNISQAQEATVLAKARAFLERNGKTPKGQNQ